ncbi:MAG: hypothetical protein I8H68_09275 [Flavobacteriia bacterium]|nr:hypothetical protein [Flavobacteriia bacterium]MBH2024712.1 hypothetical protein [Flavobacteriales bacterium]
MWKLRTYRHTASVVFAALYLFVALFSQNFHNHGSSEVFKDFNFKKSEKTYSTGHFAQEFTDCLSCHLLHDGHSLLPEDFQMTFAHSDGFQKEIFAYSQRFSKLEIRYFQLRGPPSNSI